MIRLRFVTVNASGRDALLGIYLEGLEWVAPEELEEDRAAWEARVPELRERTLDALRIERTEDEHRF